jgi:hypothetical protein
MADDTKTVELFRVDLEDYQAATIYVTTPQSVLWVYDSTGKIESHDPMDRVGGPFRISDIVKDSFANEGRRFYLCRIQDCAFPPVFLVRGEDMEDAIEYFIDYASKNLGMRITPEELPDYLNDEGEYEGEFDSDGDPVDTDNIHCQEVFLHSIHFSAHPKPQYPT